MPAYETKKIDALRVHVCTLVFLLCISGSLMAQKKVTGIVTNAKDKSPVAFATVTVKGTNIATVTSASGSFIINVPAGRNVLVFSNIGFDDAEMDVSSRDNVDISIKEKTSNLDEIVVTGYTSQKKKSLTGSVAVVSVKDLKSVPAGSPEQMLQGRASGVNIITSGQPGSGSIIRIRGITSLGNVDPLVIMDGVQSSLRDVNADDIESFQILKDGAASIYGVRGSNGVIVITTKKGKSGKATISYDAYVGTQNPLKGNVFNLTNPTEMADLTWLAKRNSNELDNGNPSHPQYGNSANPVIPDYILIGNRNGVTGEPTAEELAKYNVDYSRGGIYQIVQANKTGTDWFHEIFTNAPIQSHTVSASGGSDKSSYLFSMGYFNQQGTLVNTYLKRYSVRANTSFNIKDHIRVGENAYMFYKDNPTIGNLSEGNEISNAYRMQPIVPVYDINGGWGGARAAGLGNNSNPYASRIRAANNKGYSWNMSGNVFAEVDFLKHFTARTSFGGNMSNYYYYYYTFHTYENAENNASNGFNEGAGYYRDWTFSNTVSYTNNFGEHSVKALAGIEAFESYQRELGGGALGYFTDNPNFRTLTAGSSGFTNFSRVNNNNSLYSQFAKVDYGYADKYLLSGIIRRDGSSKFGEDSRYGIFPSVQAAWVISKENFFKGVGFVNNLKLRGSWGKLGNFLNVDPNNAFNLYGGTVDGGNIGSYYDINGTSTSSLQGFTATRIGNPKTGWEEDILTNIGLDAVLFKNKLDFSIEWYQKKINGLLFQDQVPIIATGGAAAPTINIGNIKNTGIDLSTTYHGTAGKDFKFDIGLVFTAYKNEITSIPGTGGYFDDGFSRIGAFVRNQVGQATGSFFGYNVIGIFQDQADVDKSPTQDQAKAGRFKYQDANSDGKISDADRVFFGNPNPDFTYGLNLSASYKGFDFAMFMYGSQGNDLINYVRYWIDFYPSFQGVKSKDALYNSWSPDRPNAKLVQLSDDANFSTNQTVNSYYVEDGSYLRCKSLIIGYTMPSTVLKRIGVDKCRFYVQAANLFTFTKYTGLDPELSGYTTAFGIDFGNYPNNQKNFNIGVNLSF